MEPDNAEQQPVALAVGLKVATVIFSSWERRRPAGLLLCDKLIHSPAGRQRSQNPFPVRSGYPCPSVPIRGFKILLA
jgi:hypothetical protein